MSVRPLHAELNAVRALVSDGLAAAAVGDIGQFWVRSACARLASVDALLVEAAGVLAAPVQVGLATLICFPAVALAATAAQAAGSGTAGVLAVTGLVLLVLLAATPWAGRRLRLAVGRRRLARAGRPVPAQAGALHRAFSGAPTRDLSTPGPVGTPDEKQVDASAAGASAAGASDQDEGRDRVAAVGRVPVSATRLPLAGVPDLLLRARVRLVSATLRQAGSGRWSTPELHHAARTDPVVRRLAHADLELCQAIDCLERYFDDLAKGWP